MTAAAEETHSDDETSEEDVYESGLSCLVQRTAQVNLELISKYEYWLLSSLGGARFILAFSFSWSIYDFNHFKSRYLQKGSWLFSSAVKTEGLPNCSHTKIQIHPTKKTAPIILESKRLRSFPHHGESLDFGSFASYAPTKHSRSLGVAPVSSGKMVCITRNLEISAKPFVFNVGPKIPSGRGEATQEMLDELLPGSASLQDLIHLPEDMESDPLKFASHYLAENYELIKKLNEMQTHRIMRRILPTIEERATIAKLERNICALLQPVGTLGLTISNVASYDDEWKGALPVKRLNCFPGNHVGRNAFPVDPTAISNLHLLSGRKRKIDD